MRRHSANVTSPPPEMVMPMASDAETAAMMYLTSPPPPSAMTMMLGRPQEVGAELVDRRPLVPQVVINPFDDGRWRTCLSSICGVFVGNMWRVYQQYAACLSAICSVFMGNMWRVCRRFVTCLRETARVCR